MPNKKIPFITKSIAFLYLYRGKSKSIATIKNRINCHDIKSTFYAPILILQFFIVVSFALTVFEYQQLCVCVIFIRSTNPAAVGMSPAVSCAPLLITMCTRFFDQFATNSQITSHFCVWLPIRYFSRKVLYQKIPSMIHTMQCLALS